MITKKPWFGPKRTFGWGWTPITWQGWAVTAIHLVTLFAAVGYFGLYRKDTLTTLLIAFGSSAVLIGIAMLTGTKPGGPQELI
jgi:hypothetical protein